MRLLPTLLLALTVCATSACAQRATPTRPAAKTTKAKAKPAQKTAAQTQAAPVIVFRKTSCLGPCPEYEATIYPDGRVSYMGRSNVPKMGAHEFRLAPATVKKMLADAQSLGFRKLNDRYTTKNVADLPSTFLSIRQPAGTLKTVQVEDAAPAGLQALLDYISQELDKISGNIAPVSR
ncbi:DUF6438 domain-containing protein [Hymenobacter algoricola]|uniref:DUF6438 domain-containing protein n=1 Tax=Hymenobacter algoricola TaxID=486267 RepID=A0ABP7MAD8_9BACT